jgi:CYTH domain-containing protein
VHESRIRAKRLRYLLEPVRAEVAGAKSLVRGLKALQELLGQLHDMHVIEAALETALAEASHEKAMRLRDLAMAGERSALQRERRRDERLGIVTLSAVARATRDSLYAELEKHWLGTRMVELMSEVRNLADAIGPVPETAGGWKPPLERERKFLLRRMPEHARTVPAMEIVQGWIPGRTLCERLRRVRGGHGQRFYRTVKLGSGLERIEIEEDATAEVFDAMWPLTEGCRIAKRRFRVADGKHVWEIDEFTDRDLVLAEVELAAADEEVTPPSWLSAEIVREVTDDPAYTNLSLATQDQAAASYETAPVQRV